MAATEEEVGIECYISDEVPGFSAILRHRWSDFKVYEVDLQGKVRAADLKVRGDGSSWKWRPSSASGGAGGVPVSKQAAVLSSVQLPKSLDGSADVERASVLRDESIAAVCADFSQVAGQEAAVQLREFLQAWQQCRGEGSNSEGTEAGERLGGEAQGGEGQRAVALPRQLTIGPFPDKEKRRAVHGFFRREPRIPQLESAAAAGGEDGHGQQQAWSISLEPAGAAAGAGSDTKRARRDGRGRGRGRRRGAEWRGGGLAYVRMVLWKRNMDTQAALSLLARQLGVQSKGLGIAGTKDKRGITCQFVTAWKIDPQRLQQVGRGLGGLELGNFEFVAQPLQLGQLRGNAFSLTLRNVTPAGPERLKQVAAACASAQRHGFINYFGLQRFGSGSVATHLVGAALLRGAWKEAADLIMTGRADERREVAEARTKYFAGDIKGALDGMPKKCVAESAVLSALSKRGGKDYVGALCSIPRHLRSMFLHAFQSFLWNKAVSHRIRTAGGRAVVQGDLVIPAASADVGPSDGGAAEAEADDGGRGDAPGSAAVARLEAVHVVSAEEAACGRFSMEEVVLPLPGHLTLLPHHSTAEVYRSLAAQLGVDLAVAPHSVREFSVAHQRGDYRHLIHRPADLTFRLIRHASLDDELESAADGPLKPDGSCNDDTGWLQSISLAQPACAPGPGPGRKRKAPDNAPDAPPDADSAAKPWPDRLGCEVPVEGSGEYVSLQLRFGLPASGYATMLVREVMKTSTSTSFHRRLTAAELNQAPALDNPVADATDGPPS